MAIDKFAGKYRFLSNFWPAKVNLDGEDYPSVEHAYQAAKYPFGNKNRSYIQTTTAGIAKAYGSRASLPMNWESLKISIMNDLLMQKFRHEDLRVKLLATGTEELIEGNTWGDTFWGVYNGVGQNNLGKLLMNIRTYYRSKND